MVFKAKTLNNTVITVILQGLEAKNLEKYCYYCYLICFGIQPPRKRVILRLCSMFCEGKTKKHIVITIMLKGFVEVKPRK